MKTIKNILEEKELGEEILIQKVNVNGTEYQLNIMNRQGRIIFDFYNSKDKPEGESEYRITIDEKGIGFNRHCYRRNHDHDDSQSLQKVQVGNKKELHWVSRFPYSGEGSEFFKVVFGSVEVDY
jgi:hypothetical protein